MSTFQGCFNTELGPYKSVLNIEVSTFQGCFNTELGPYKSVLNIEVSTSQGCFNTELGPYKSVLNNNRGVLISGVGDLKIHNYIELGL